MVRSRHRWKMLAVSLLVAAAVLLAWGPAAATAADPPSVSAPSALVMDATTGVIVYAKDIRQRRPMASCTKIMTALLVLERFDDLSRPIRVPSGVQLPSGIGLRAGERITVRQALLALILKSANDAAVTLACATAGSEARFVTLMNRRAAQLGLTDTWYRNCRGNVRDDGHYSSVRDLARLSRAAMRRASFRDLVGRQRAVLRWGANRELAVLNGNLLLHQEWATGVKAGYTPRAGYCLVGAGKPGLRSFVTASLGASDRTVNTLDHIALFQWASTLYERIVLVNAFHRVATLPVEGGGSVPVLASATIERVVRKGAAVTMRVSLPSMVREAPPRGAIVGSATFRSDGTAIAVVGLIAGKTTSPTSSPQTDRP